MTGPKISVIIPSYNHQNFIARTIGSVLSQTLQDFEIIITDDGSKDGTSSVIEKFRDPRIKFFKFPENKGACEATNNCIRQASGEYIALINSDDMWRSDKLEKQVEVFLQNPYLGAVFTNAKFVNELDQPLGSGSGRSYSKIFHQANRAQGQWLRRFFDEGNCLCHPSILIKKSCYANLGLYNDLYKQLPDFDMWVRLVKSYSIHVLDEELVDFRILDNQANASSPTKANSNRGINELFFIFDGFFKGCSEDVFRSGFSDHLVHHDFHGPEELFCEITSLLVSKKSLFPKITVLVGLRMLGEGLSRPKIRKILSEKYNLTSNSFQSIMGSSFIFQEDPPEYASKSKSLLWTNLDHLKARLLNFIARNVVRN